MVALRAAGRPVALAVDELLGKEEIVVRGLGEFLGSVGPFGGATLSDEGRIILLLDPARLLETPGASAAVAVPARAEPPITPAAPAEPPGPRRILLVDDSISVRKFVGQMLERAGFAVITAADGVEGLQVLEETPVDAVITDLEMPRLNGFELIDRVLAHRGDVRRTVAPRLHDRRVSPDLVRLVSLPIVGRHRLLRSRAHGLSRDRPARATRRRPAGGRGEAGGRAGLPAAHGLRDHAEGSGLADSEGGSAPLPNLPPGNRVAPAKPALEQRPSRRASLSPTGA